MDAQLDKLDYQPGDTITVRVNIPAAGYLNVIGIDSEDSMVLLYPNKFNPNNKVEEGWLELPGKLDFDWVAQPPWGRNMLLALYTEDETNLFESSLQKNQSGIATVDYALPSLEALRRQGFGVDTTVPKDLASRALFFNACKSANDCK
jgi:hypothetical protein